MSSNDTEDGSLDVMELCKAAFVSEEPSLTENTKAIASYPNIPVSLPVNQLLTTVQNVTSTVEDSATSDYESTCSDSSFQFRHIIMSPRVLSPDSQTPSSGAVSQKEAPDFDFDDSSDVSVDAYKSEPELVVNALITARDTRLNNQRMTTGQSASSCSPAGVSGNKSKRAFVFDVEKVSSEDASESFRRWRKSASDSTAAFRKSSKSVVEPISSAANQLPSFAFGANKAISAFKLTNTNLSSGAKEKMDSKKGLSGISKLCEQKEDFSESSYRYLGRSSSLPLSLHVATSLEHGSSGANIGQLSPCATPAAAQPGALSPFCGVFQSSFSPSFSDVKRSRCPSSSSRCSASSPRPPSRIDQIKIEEATGLERDTLFERDVTLSSSLASSWEDLCLSEHAANSMSHHHHQAVKRPRSVSSSHGANSPSLPIAAHFAPNANNIPPANGNDNQGEALGVTAQSRVTEPISISCSPAYNPTIYPLACSPSPTRVSQSNSKQCYSPSLQMPLNWSASCPSPTQRKIFRRSQSPVTNLVRPGILGNPLNLKRRPADLDSLEHTPCKRPAPDNTPPPPPPPPFFSAVSSTSAASHSLAHSFNVPNLLSQSHDVITASPASTPSSPPPFGSPVRCVTPSYLSPLISERDKLHHVSHSAATVESPLSEEPKVVNLECTHIADRN